MMNFSQYSNGCVHPRCPFSIRVKLKGEEHHHVYTAENGATFEVQDTQEVPCGKCLLCLYKRSQEWIKRLKISVDNQETQSLFVTLTYNDAFVPQYISGVTGCITPVLEKRDLQLFLKRLRKNVSIDFGDNIRIKYFAVGEYGSETKRPHYHLIIMGLPNFSDRISAQAYFEKAWSLYGESLGFVTVDKVTPNRVAYICKYMTIANCVPVEFLEDMKCNKYEITRIVDEYQSFRPFLSCSHGIGIEFLTDNMVKWVRDNGRITYYDIDNKTGKPYEKSIPTYLLRKIYSEDELLSIKERKTLYRKEMEAIFDSEVRKWWKSKYDVAGYNYDDYFDLHDNPIWSFTLDSAFECVRIEFNKMLYRAFVKARTKKNKKYL